MIKWKRAIGVAAWAGCAAWGGALGQTTYTWSGGGSTGHFSDTNNWGGANGNQVGIQSFAGTNRLTPTADGTGTFNTHRLYFQSNAGAFVLSGREITLSDYGGADPTIRNLSTNAQTILNNLRGDSTANDDPLRVQANNGDLILRGDITNRGSALIIEGGSDARYVALGGAVRGSPNVEINSAQLRILEGGSLDPVGGGIYVGNGGSTNTAAALHIADLDGGTTIGKALHINAGSGAAGNRVLGALNGTGTNVFSGDIARGTNGNRALTLAQTGGGTVDFDGVISGDHKVMIEGPGVVRYGGVNTYAANTEIHSGELHVKEGAVVAAAGQRIYVGSGSTPSTRAGLYIADLDGGTTVGQGLRVNPGTDHNRVIGGLNVTGTNVFSGAVDLSGSGDRTAALHAEGGGAVAFSGAVSGGGGIVKAGGGTVELRGDNTYSGATVVAEGLLRVDNAFGSGTGSGTVTVRNGGSLGGEGRIATSAFAVESGGTMAQAGLGELTIDLGETGQATFDAGAQFTFSITLAGAADRIGFEGSGAIVFHDNVVNIVDLTGGGLESGVVYDLFRISAGSTVSGQLVLGAGLEGYAGSTLSIQGTSVQLQVGAVPEPATAALLGWGLAAVWALRWRR